MDFEKITQELKSKFSDERNVLGLELLLTAVSIASIVFLAYTAGEEVSKLLVFPVSAILFVPFFSTLAYYREFRKTALSTILSVVIIPAIFVGGSILIYLPSRGGGLAVIFAVLYSSIAAAILPYIIFAAVLAVHYYRENFQGEQEK